MAELSAQSFNPCSLKNRDEQIPAKIWELLRRNRAFGETVDRLADLDAKERGNHRRTGKYHGKAWYRSRKLVLDVIEENPFAGVALQWLVPEPLFHCRVVTWPRGKNWKKRPVFRPRCLRVGVGATPNVNSKEWVWRVPGKHDISGHSMVRGPELHWTTSRSKSLRDLVNPLLEWSRYHWPFTVNHAWSSAPAEFQRTFLYIWRRQFDCRPTNPISKDRSDSPFPREISFFHDWKLSDFCASGQKSLEDLYQILRFNELAKDYRIFAIPKTVITKGSAIELGGWLEAELKKGSDLYGDLLENQLLDESELLGLNTEWKDWLAHAGKQTAGEFKHTHLYRRCRYMDSLVALVFPKFNVAKLLAKPTHRSRGKKYCPKIRNE